MAKLLINAWEIYFHPQLFGTQYQELFDRVSHLREKLPESEFKTHATAKLFAAITVAIESKIPSDPFASHFALTGVLKRYGRVKKMGLPQRYRLFFQAFDTPQLKAIVILWLGFPRKEGAKNDCYEVFTKMVARGTFPDTLDELIAEEEKIDKADED
ncbi:type II toxin-antitoxin system YhaV family toxin [Aetokthonos hydrillicola Thurmond2011]|uniref:Type II toxin-antitoxin system YhaV family toxin n=1 Tax=Aetokthonos hydrillicola Thurmond2011 TaxID=2712845 RepID=A0AAP5M6K7_9CYAN|nr:type II toxin-antitoxin system YhaV family toxin [Aetokthonos hydrillicola]MBO3458596.1 type II toxin-antitoxin system YhaV family toxin [Aetokthonos hydrillicola CCALA 1050]MBW4585039.1 type II toxin-antitoxin system YhaV family toxin [Aetokthonos hydrillicola CCALA 1050]MDR9894200.1 type II toxin-antitoxin system YhaV family toxin [Aetokthonos hydrillicola Thurmond2011]